MCLIQYDVKNHIAPWKPSVSFDGSKKIEWNNGTCHSLLQAPQVPRQKIRDTNFRLPLTIHYHLQFIIVHTNSGFFPQRVIPGKE